jgi:hypothetical protein
MQTTFLPCKWLTLGVVFASISPLLFAQPEGYYDTVDDSSPQALRTSLHEIIDDHKRYPYTSSLTDTWDILVSSGGVFDSAEPVVGPPVKVAPCRFSSPTAMQA